MTQRCTRFCFSLFLSFFAIGISVDAKAASCCGGGLAIPTLIAGDEKASLSAELAYANVKTEVTSSGVWRDRTTPESIRTMRISGSHIFLDRFQAGGSVPLVSRNRGEETQTGLGDIGLNLGYEILPEWEYSAWRPKGITFLSLTAPTGRSVQEATAPMQLDARGRGFWAIGAGALFTKAIRRWDVFANVEAHYSFAKEVRTESFEGELIPRYGTTASLGAGYNLGDARIGAAVLSVYEDAVATRGTIQSNGSVSRYMAATLSAGYLFEEVWSASLQYTDQTWFGSPVTTSLSRAVSFSLQRRFSR